MLRDRGKMKWQGFFMMEHVNMLWDMEEEYLRTARPLLDEGQLFEILESKYNDIMKQVE
ncbi:hypothetical protein AB1K32_26130 [Metabacillus dongyingensis]|uniref:hypothetical protein n=1 Tax=Metabacillus dongyingensis TaxID=2874282 RepID=UPI003B8ABD50